MKKSLTISALSALVLATSSFAGAPSSPPAIGSQIEDYDIFNKAKQIKLSTVVVIENLEKSTSDEDRLAGFDKGNGKDVTNTKKISVTVNDLLEQSGIEGAAKLYEADCNLVVTDANGKVLRDPRGSCGFAFLNCGPEISADKESIKTDSKDRYKLSENGTQTENVTLEFELAPVTTGEEGKVNYTFEQTSITLDARVITKSKGKSAGVVVRSGDGEIYRDVVDFNKYSSSSKSNALIGDFYVEKYKMVLDGTELVEEDLSETYGVVAKGKLSAKAKNKANASDAVVANTVALYEGQVVVLAAKDAFETALAALEAAYQAVSDDTSTPKTPSLLADVAAAQEAFEAAEKAFSVEERGYLFSDAILALYPLFNADQRAVIELQEAVEVAEDAAIALLAAQEALDIADQAVSNDTSTPTTPALLATAAAALTERNTAQKEDDDAKAAVKAAEDKSDAAFAAASPDLDAAITAYNAAQEALDAAEKAVNDDTSTPKTPSLLADAAAAQEALDAAQEAVEVANGVDEQNRRDYSEETFGILTVYDVY